VSDKGGDDGLQMQVLRAVMVLWRVQMQKQEMVHVIIHKEVEWEMNTSMHPSH
jgi:hypothetical protein